MENEAERKARKVANQTAYMARKLADETPEEADIRRAKNRLKSRRHRTKMADDPEFKKRKSASNARWRAKNLASVKERNRAWRELNPAKRRENGAKWREANKASLPEKKALFAKQNAGRIAAYQLAYRAKHKARMAALRAERREKTPEVFAAIRRRWREKNPAYHRRRYATDTQYKAACLLRSRLIKAIKSIGDSKAYTTSQCIGCTPAELIMHLASLFEPGMSWSNHGKWHIDHIKPCATFDLTDPEQQKACFHYTNLQPLWAVDNLRKSGPRLTQRSQRYVAVAVDKTARNLSDASRSVASDLPSMTPVGPVRRTATAFA